MSSIYDMDEVAVRTATDPALRALDSRMHKVARVDFPNVGSDEARGNLLAVLIRVHGWVADEMVRRGLVHATREDLLRGSVAKVRTDLGEFTRPAPVAGLPAIAVGRENGREILAEEIGILAFPEEPRTRGMIQGTAEVPVILLAGPVAIGRAILKLPGDLSNRKKLPPGTAEVAPIKGRHVLVRFKFLPFTAPIPATARGMGPFFDEGAVTFDGVPIEKQAKRRVVLAFVYDDDDRVLLVKRRLPPIVWSAPDGFVKSGEDPGKAARRAVKEEIGVELRDAFVARELGSLGERDSFAVVARARTTELKPSSKMREAKWIEFKKIMDFSTLSPGVGSFRRSLSDLHSFERLGAAEKQIQETETRAISPDFLLGLAKDAWKGEGVISELEQGDGVEKMAPPFGMPGGKHWQKNQIVRLIPDHKKYVEPFVGAGSVFLHKEPSGKEVISDKDPSIVFFYRYAKKHGGSRLPQLKRRFDWSITENGHAKFKKIFEMKPRDDDERVFQFLWLQGASWRGDRTTFQPSQSKRKFTVLDRLDEYQERLKGVEILRSDFESVIRKHDGPDTFFFMDPPYEVEGNKETEATRHGEWFGKIEPDRLRKVIRRMRGRFILTLPDTKLWDEFDFGAKVLKRKVAVRKQDQVSQRPTIRHELWFSNFKLAAIRKVDGGLDGDHPHPHEPNGVHDHEGLPPETGGHAHVQTDPSVASGLSGPLDRLKIALGGHRHNPQDPIEGVHIGTFGSGAHLHPLARDMEEQLPIDLIVEAHEIRPWLPGFKRAMIRERPAPDAPFGQWRLWSRFDSVVHVLHPLHVPAANVQEHEALFLDSSSSLLIQKRYEIGGVVRSPTSADFDQERRWFERFAQQWRADPIREFMVGPFEGTPAAAGEYEIHDAGGGAFELLWKDGQRSWWMRMFGDLRKTPRVEAKIVENIETATGPIIARGRVHVFEQGSDRIALELVEAGEDVNRLVARRMVGNSWIVAGAKVTDRVGKAFHIRGVHWMPPKADGSCPAAFPKKEKLPRGGDRCFTRAAARAFVDSRKKAPATKQQKTGEFVLQRRFWRVVGQVREGPAAEFWHLRLDLGGRFAPTITVESDPTKSNSSTGTYDPRARRRNLTRTGTFSVDQIDDPKPEKEGSVTVEELDRGRAELLEDRPEEKVVRLGGEKLFGVFTIRDEGGGAWSLTRRKEAAASGWVDKRIEAEFCHAESRRVVKRDGKEEELRLVWAIVYEPYKVDAQGDWANEETIARACWGWAIKGAKFKLMHREDAPWLRVAENYVTKIDGERIGRRKLRKGTWVVAFFVEDEARWREIKAGKYRGISLGGRSRVREGAPPSV